MGGWVGGCFFRCHANPCLPTIRQPACSDGLAEHHHQIQPQTNRPAKHKHPQTHKLTQAPWLYPPRQIHTHTSPTHPNIHTHTHTHTNTGSMVIGFLFGCASALLFKHVDIRHSIYEMGVYLLLAYIPSLFSAVRFGLCSWLAALPGIFVKVCFCDRGRRSAHACAIHGSHFIALCLFDDDIVNPKPFPITHPPPPQQNKPNTVHRAVGHRDDPLHRHVLAALHPSQPQRGRTGIYTEVYERIYIRMHICMYKCIHR